MRDRRPGRCLPPIARSTEETDYILELLLEHTTADLSYADALGVTYEQVHADPEAALADIVAKYHTVAEQCDAVVIIGSDYTDVASPSELSFNARIAVNLGAPVLLAVRGARRSVEEVAQLAHLCAAELAANHAHLLAVVANRCDPDKLDEVTAALSDIGVPTWSLPEIPLLVSPTMAELMEATGGELYSGDPELLHREALKVMVGGMTAEHILERLVEGMVVIAPGDRSDVLLALLNAHEAEGFPSLAGIIMNGGITPHPAIAALMAGLKQRLPILTTTLGTFDTASAAAQTRGRVAVGSQRKVDTALSLMEQRVDADVLMDRLALPIPSVVTPQMFEYKLIDRARRDRKHIVLPEGDDDRILRAAGRLLQRQVADLTILGDEPSVRRRAAELGVDISGAQVLAPAQSEYTERFAQEYTALRAHKGMTIERAREVIADISYFGTMMVHLGIADGMVSGAAHTTAHTIRPLVRDHQDRPRCLDGFEHLPDVPGRPRSHPTVTAPWFRTRRRSSWRTSRSRPHRRRRSSGSIRASRCSRTPPGIRAAEPTSTRFAPRPLWCASGDRICWWKGPFSTMPPSSRVSPTRRCRILWWRAKQRCSCSRT